MLRVSTDRNFKLEEKFVTPYSSSHLFVNIVYLHKALGLTVKDGLMREAKKKCMCHFTLPLSAARRMDAMKF